MRRAIGNGSFLGHHRSSAMSDFSTFQNYFPAEQLGAVAPCYLNISAKSPVSFLKARSAMGGL